jgi:hypothetical protein
MKTAVAVLFALVPIVGCANTTGQWVDGGTLELVGIHSAVMPDGRVLAFGYKDRHHVSNTEGRWQLWDPRTRAPVDTSTLIANWNPFCAGHSFLGDGRLFIAGGHKSSDPRPVSSATQVATVSLGSGDPALVWRRDFGEMEDLRWYPTVVTLPNGDALISGGSAPVLADNWAALDEMYEYFSLANDYLVRFNESQRKFPRDAAFAWPSGDQRQRVEDGKRLAGLYPLTHVLPASGGDAPNGILFVITESFLRLYNPSTNSIIAPKVDVGGFRTWWTQGSSVLLPIDVDENGNPARTVQVMVVGGGTLGKKDATAPALGTAEIWTYSVTNRAIQLESTIPLRHNRFMGDSLLLPDGNVVVVGGAEIGYTNRNSRRVRFAELIRPTPRDTVDLAEAAQLRGYHASALLLPDGAVFVTGGTGGWGTGFEELNAEPVDEFMSVEVFEPPYLSLGERPRIIEAPATLQRGETFTILVEGAAIEPVVVLSRNNSRTHSLDTDQRMLRLRARATADGGRTMLTAVVPTNATYAVPGPYQVFALARARNPHGAPPQTLIPSEARHLLLRTSQVRPPLMVSRIRLTIHTGGDDLRGGNDNATASFRNEANMVVVNDFALNGTSHWPDWTVHTVTQSLSPPVPLAQLAKIRIATTFGGGAAGDNWNIDRLIVDYDAGSGWQTLYDQSSPPLARLTGERPTWTAFL